MGDLAEYPGALRAYVVKEPIRSAVSVPLLGRNNVVGVMNPGAATTDYFDVTTVDLLLGLGRQIASGVDQARLYENMTRSGERLRCLTGSGAPRCLPFGDQG
jgi:GAF domain-containing protein